MDTAIEFNVRFTVSPIPEEVTVTVVVPFMSRSSSSTSIVNVGGATPHLATIPSIAAPVPLPLAAVVMNIPPVVFASSSRMAA